MTLNISNYKAKLEAEKNTLEQELKSVGRINTSNPQDWEAVQIETTEDVPDRAEVAEGITEYEENTAILKQLDTQLFEVKLALTRIEKGTFGICEVCGKEIESERLDANTSARTCIQHIDSVL